MCKLFSIFFVALHCMVYNASGQALMGRIDSSLLPVQSLHYFPEYVLDQATNLEAWAKQKKSLHVSFATTNELFLRTEVPDLEENNLWNDMGWRGERLNTQLLLWSLDTLYQIHLTVHDLKNQNGKVFKGNNIKPFLVRYVLSNHPYGDKNVSCEASPHKDAFLLPDRFEEFKRFDLPGKTVRPVWLSVDIPAETQPGIYTGILEVHSAKNTSILSIKIRVQGQVLPKPHDWKFRLDLWQNPWVVADYYNVHPWSPEHLELLKEHLKLYADAGGKFITTYGVHSPWADVSYATEGGMIEWIKKKDSSWIFDYSIFDTYVQLAMQMGIDKAITVYTPVPWGNRFRYIDESTGNYNNLFYAPGTEEYKSLWNIFLTSLKAHLQKKGWLNKTYLGINESEMSQTLAAIKVIKEHSPLWKITYAGDWHPELDTLLNDYSYLYGKEPTTQQENQRSKRGTTSSYYVCCNPPVPNTFVFSPPIEGRWLGWYAAANNYDGFLRWAYDAWPADPLRDPRQLGWGTGDCLLVYPGGNSSIRFEKLREGIVDFEKMRILRAKAKVSADKNVRSLLKELDEHLKIFPVEKDFNSKKISGDVKKGNELIARISDMLH
ncbi:MAG: glycoside hydrolase domain-containing protein [Ginsengibacter sp.]